MEIACKNSHTCFSKQFKFEMNFYIVYTDERNEHHKFKASKIISLNVNAPISYYVYTNKKLHLQLNLNSVRCDAAVFRIANGAY